MKTIKLGEALALLKSKKSRLAELQAQRVSSFYVEEGLTADFTYPEITEEIKAVSNELIVLKLRITEANLNNHLPDGKTLMEAIIRIGEYRSALNNLHQIIRSGGRGRFFNEGNVPTLPQVPLKQIDKDKREVTQKKALLDNMLQAANWKVDVEVPS